MPTSCRRFGRATHQEARKLDLDLMRSAAELFLGRHDWTAFRPRNQMSKIECER